MPEPDWKPWQVAWEQALYGPAGFYTHQNPASHYRTSTHSALFAEAVLRLVRRLGLSSVTDLGAGSGELLGHLHRQAPDLELAAVEIRPRPVDLAAPIRWLRSLPDRVDGLLLANEVLDNVPCSIAQADSAGDVRVVETRAETGTERLGSGLGDHEANWANRWWPAEPGERIEIGSARDDTWSGWISRSAGFALAIDYGHTSETRPAGGTFTAYRNGRQVSPRADATCDLTAHVAFDSLAARVGGTLTSQRDALLDLGLVPVRPAPALARTQPQAYLAQLALATQAADLTAGDGLGGFFWLLTDMRA